MYQPAHLDSFLHLLVAHLGTIVDQGEQIGELANGELRRDFEALFVLQMSQAREWADRLGQLDPDVERETDEFLVTTFAIEKRLDERASRGKDYRLENRMAQPGSDKVLRGDLQAHIDVEAMMQAVFVLLARLEEQYDLMEELLAEKQVVNGVAFAAPAKSAPGAQIIALPVRKSASR